MTAHLLVILVELDEQAILEGFRTCCTRLVFVHINLFMFVMGSARCACLAGGFFLLHCGYNNNNLFIIIIIIICTS